MNTLNIGSKTNDWRARELSNFASGEFIVFGIRLASVEGFWVGLKFDEGSLEQLKAFTLSGYEAKKFGYRAPKRGSFTFQGRTYKVGSPEHQNLMRLALRAKFTQVEKARRALLATKGLVLTHIMPRDSITIPGAVFSRMLMDIREEVG